MILYKQYTIKGYKLDMNNFKEKFNYVFDKYGNKIIWFILGLQALIVSITSYN
jgi:hypothetical protein